MRKLYNWMMAKAATPQAEAALAFVAFIESSIFPLPPDLMLVPMALAERRKAFRYALICTVASVLGGLVGYGIGFFLYETVGRWILNLYGGADVWYEKFKGWFDHYGALIIIGKGLTPFPFKVVTIISGMVKFNLALFIGTSIIARAMRFFLVAGLLYAYGEKIRPFLEKHLEKVLAAFLVLLVGGFVLLKLFI
jgi:membrane protein YqaA with SNARE-associated domain